MIGFRSPAKATRRAQTADERTPPPLRAIALLVLKIVAYSILVVWACVSLLPIYWMLTTAVKSSTTMLAVPPQWIPRPVTLQHFKTVMSTTNFGWWVFNTAFVSTVVTVGNVLNSALCAYAFAKLRFPGRQTIFWIMLSLITVPGVVVWVPLFILISNLQLINTYWVLIVPGLA